MAMKEPLRLSLVKARAVYDEDEGANGVTVLDVVDGGAYPHFEHEIAGAVRIDPDDIEEEYGSLPKEHTILTYCTCDNDEISARIAYFLRKEGYDAYAIEGGLPAWQEASHPVHEKEMAVQAEGGD